jgi:N utilization substance protein B
MLNRRILRVKAMQSLYAFKKSEESNYQLALAAIEEAYKEALMEKGAVFRAELAEQQEQSKELFKAHLAEGKAEQVLGEHPDLLGKAAWQAIVFYRTQAARDARNFLHKMISDTENLFAKYLRVLQLFVTLADRIRKVQRDREENQHGQGFADFTRFFTSPAIEALRNHPDVAKENYHWEPDLVAAWATALRKDEGFLALVGSTPEGPEGDRDLLLYILRDFIFEHEAVQAYFEEQDLNWAENGRVLRSMLSKTLKSIAEEGPLDVLELSKNWDDDREFFQQLFERTLEREQDWEARITLRTKRWASDRIATVDKILLKMALTEMVAFPSIPVKVTINEYIEVSKSYSTPKSWQFMNGLLDAISNDLQEEGVIRKSGRGLLDNK